MPRLRTTKQPGNGGSGVSQAEATRPESGARIETAEAATAVAEPASADGNGSSPTMNEGEHQPSRQLLAAMLAFRNGDFSQRLPAEWPGVYGKIAAAFNDVLMINGR